MNPMLLVITPGQGISLPGNVGPLIACPTNKNYWATPDGKAIWVGGSHAWPDADQNLNNPSTGNSGFTTLTFKEFIDRNSTYESANWVRFWIITNPTWASGDTVPLAQMPFALPNGSGQWDLTNYNQPQWDQWRNDIIYAVEKTPPVYIQVELWSQGEGFFNTSNSPWFHNVNGCNPTQPSDLFTTTSGPIWAAMTGYAQKWMDECHDLPNVVWDILGNELTGDAAHLAWGNSMMSFMRNYEKTKGYIQHPFIFASSSGGGGAYSGDQSLWSSAADCVVPGWGDTVTSGLFGPGSTTGYDTAPPPGSKPGMIDTDHTTSNNQSPDQVLCIFTRGWGGFGMMDIEDDTVTNSPVSTAAPLNQFMVPGFGTGYNGTDFTPANSTTRKLTRQAIWAARTASLLVNMTHMTPSGASSSTNRCLAASDSTEFIAYQPTLGASFTVNLPAGFLWSVEWVDANTQTTISGSQLAT